ncbi:iron-containing alcohol dehydrogenase [Caldicellulosiruptor morganii]|uniref:iron-containing alcohol dehydrogenase n=1 Tax=Caldicellulosiruptor morganii TaxID=1387555 RepID=UPI0023428AF0|nr:iron-containing alcohol dehydrogenase [Caldicellulosiruptor morganii]
MAGVAFNNAVWLCSCNGTSIRRFYDLPHGVCNAVLLPHVLAYNLKVVPHRFIDIAKAMGIDVQGASAEKAGEMVIESIKALSKEIGIPSGLKEFGCKR